MKKEKWILEVDRFIKNYFDSVLREIPVSLKQGIPLDDLKRYNSMVVNSKTRYKKGRAEIIERFEKLDLTPLAVIPGMIHEFGLGSGVFSELHRLDINKARTTVVHHPLPYLSKMFSTLSKTERDHNVVEEEIKNYCAHTAEYLKCRLKVSLPDISCFDSKIKLCRSKRVMIKLYPTMGNYHFKRFIPKELWNNFEPNEELLLVARVILNKKSSWDFDDFQVVLDQIPTIDKYEFKKRYQLVSSSDYLARHCSLLGNHDFKPYW
ncbi:MAG: hypothetical protein NUV82_01750 [Candidatus Komeilibacteria bacterium]|nr:hypothetical protein [Candidatus Komeilibacteria bacterium]